ncbi:hypothetical protein KSU1_C0341 [Candidatus Jettenia caeni]|uniref:Uncharacterized protein n=1 Tax=Candidatus Jettenia caeni TaxID=247490 RepID=I3IJP2_9BACT|nr:hypothetical protein KSU1_C0341 [Candidatus Jettenia caeni]
MSKNAQCKKSGINIQGLMTRKFAKISILRQPLCILLEKQFPSEYSVKTLYVSQSIVFVAIL